MPATLPRPPFTAFPSWRPGQLETVEAVMQSRRRFQLVTAPTGSGKSLIAAALVQPSLTARTNRDHPDRDEAAAGPVPGGLPRVR